MTIPLRSWSLAAACLAGVAAAPAYGQEQAAPPAGQDQGFVLDDDFVITGNAALLAHAQAVKQNADTVTDSTGLMDIATFPDHTRAASLSRLAGVTMQASGWRDLFDERISVRGLPWIARTTDGHDTPLLPSALYDSRRSTLLIAGSALSEISVAKTRNAKTIEGGIAATVDYRTQNPLDFGIGTASAGVGATAGNAGGTGWQASGLALDRTTTALGEIAWLATADWQRDRRGTDSRFADTSQSGAGRERGTLERLSANTALQWLPNDNWMISLTAATVRADPGQSQVDAITAGTGTIDRTTAIARHLRNDSAGLTVNFNASDNWTFDVAANFDETRAVRHARTTVTGTTGSPQATNDDDAGLAQLWSYRFDGSYRLWWDYGLSFGFRGTSAKSTTARTRALRQDTYAGYVQADIEYNWDTLRLTGNAGVRVVRTETTSAPGRIVLPVLAATCSAPPAASCTDYALAARFVGTGGTVAAPGIRNAYTSVLPSLNLSLWPSDITAIRFAYSGSIARPDLADIRNAAEPAFTFGTAPASSGSFAASPAGTAGNPNLRPMRADNYDFGVEYYFGPMSSVTADVFHKDLSGVFAPGTRTIALTHNGVTVPFAAATTVNGGDGALNGAEFGFQHLFSSAPFPLSDLMLQANYTLLDPHGTVPGELARHSANAILVWEHDEVWTRLAYHWQSGSLAKSRAAADATLFAGPLWREASGTLDAAVWYTILDRYRIGLEAENLLRQNLHYDAAPSSVFAAETGTERRFTLSLRATW